MTEEAYSMYLKACTAANVLSMDSFALAFCAHNDALQAAREIMLAERAGELGKSMDEFNEARDKAVELRRAGRLKAPSDRKLLESLRKADTPQLSTISAQDFAPLAGGGKTAAPVTLAALSPDTNNRYSWTDIGNGNLFADWYKDTARYVPERKQWFVYDGRAWRPDAGGLRVMEMCKKLADALNLYALSLRTSGSGAHT